MESTGQAKAEAQSRAEAAKIEGEAAVEQAKLKAEASKIEAVSSSITATREYIVGLQQIFDSFGYSLEFCYSNSKINIRYSLTYVL